MLNQRKFLKKGQAMIEFTICLFVGLIVISALLSYSELIINALDLHGELRAEAGHKALSAPIGTSKSYIQNWNKGSDGIAFTADDTPISSGLGMMAVNSIVEKSAEKSSDWDFPKKYSKLTGTILNLHDVSTLPITFSEAKDSKETQVNSFASEYIFGSEELTVEHSVYLPMCGNLF